MSSTEMRCIPANTENSEISASVKFRAYSKMIWIFWIGSIAGAVVETLWRVVAYGELVYRSSLVLSPLLVICGLGTVAMYWGKRLVKNNKLYMFLYGFVACTVIEYVASILQEATIGSVSWDYSNIPLNFGGRVNLALSICWGVLSVLWYITLMPRIELRIAKTSERTNRVITYVLTIFLIADVLVTIYAMARWEMRLDGIPPGNTVSVFIDNIFHNEYMEMVFASLIRLN